MLLIKNGHIKTMAGPDIPCGCVLIDNGKIVSVAETIDVPADAEVIDAGGRIVAPGFVDAHCHIGISEEIIGAAGSGCNENVDATTPHVRAIDGVNPFDESFQFAREAGVTTAVTGPGSANVVGGTFVALKTYGIRVDKMIIKYPVAMKIAFGENPKNRYGAMLNKSPRTRMGNAAVLRELLFKSKRYQLDMDASLVDPDLKAPAFDMKLDAMLPVMRKEIPLKAHAHRADDIFTAIRIAREFDLDITLDHCTDGSLIADELAEEKLPVFIGPSFGSKSKFELINKSFDTPGDLAKAGVKFGIITDAPVTPLQYLPLCAGLAIKAGLDYNTAWRAVTIDPAELTGIADRVGSLEPGKDADVVIHNGDPLLDIGSSVYKTIINGKVVVG